MILGIAVMIFLHELGHYLTARWSGMKVTEFFIGFGPKIWSFRRGETEYGLKVLPAGAYVRIIGMNNLDEVDPADEPRTYRQQSFPKRLLVVSAGSLMHLAQAWVLLVLALGVAGVPGGSIVPGRQAPAEAWIVRDVSEDSAAQAAGFRDGDRITGVDGASAASFEGGLTEVLRDYDVGDTVAFTVERDGAERSIEADLGPRPAGIPGGRPGTPFLGVTSEGVLSSEPVGLAQGVLRSPGELVRFSGESMGALVGFFSPSGLGEFADTVGDGSQESAPQPAGGGSADDGGENRLISIFGVIRLGSDIAEHGAVGFLLIFIQINIVVGIINMLPLVPLDGGHAAFAIYERLRSRPGRRYYADMAKLLPVAYAVVMGIVLLGVTSLYLDIVNPVDV
jgi:membrane-associated protease RseP (regulator of RpoE activity)